MRYPIAIEPGDTTHSFGVVVPDLPGCFSAGDTLDDAIEKAAEAIAFWIDTVIDDGGMVPSPSAISVLQADPGFSGWVWALVDIDPSTMSDKAERVNITLPARILRRIDAAAKAHHESRSGFLARAALMAMREA